MLASPDQIINWLRRWTACCGLLLLGGTHRLWIDRASFPQVPFFEGLVPCPLAMDWIALALLIVALVAMALGRRSAALANGLALISAVLLIAVDQQRLQPWMVQLGIFLVLFSLSDRRRALRLLRLTVISIYAYSALGKFDFQFLHSVGLDFLQGLGGLAGFDSSHWTMTAQVLSAALFPITELLIAVGLMTARFRRVAGFLACLLHLVLVLLFSPLGLGHSAGVVLWNIQFAIQAIMLFSIREAPSSDEQLEVPQDSPGTSGLATVFANMATLLVVLIMLLPLTERFGYWDHWPSWALYAPHSSRVEVQVASTALDRLPPELRKLLDDSSEAGVEQLWVNVPLDRWCLQATTAPVYPQDRSQLGVARFLAERLDSEFEIRIAVLGVANRFTGTRSVRYFEGITAITGAADSFWLNTTPRRMYAAEHN